MGERSHLGSNPLAQLVPSLPDYAVDPERTALVVVDMQYLDAHPDWGLGKRARELGIFEHLVPYFARVRAVTSRILELRESMRRCGGHVIYLALSSARPDRRDVCPRHYWLGLTPAVGTREAEILEELAPGPNEIVIHKSSSSPFNSTNIDYVLHNLGVDTLIVTGVLTNGCVEGTVRDAADRSFRVILVEDATAAFTDELHRASINNVRGTFATVKSTADLVAELSVMGAVR